MGHRGLDCTRPRSVTPCSLSYTAYTLRKLAQRSFYPVLCGELLYTAGRLREVVCTRLRPNSTVARASDSARREWLNTLRFWCWTPEEQDRHQAAERHLKDTRQAHMYPLDPETRPSRLLPPQRLPIVVSYLDAGGPGSPDQGLADSFHRHSNQWPVHAFALSNVIDLQQKVARFSQRPINTDKYLSECPTTFREVGSTSATRDLSLLQRRHSAFLGRCTWTHLRREDQTHLEPWRKSSQHCQVTRHTNKRERGTLAQEFLAFCF